MRLLGLHSKEHKAQDPEEHDPPPTISSFAASYYENLKSDALNAAANGIKTEFQFVSRQESKYDTADEERIATEAECDPQSPPGVIDAEKPQGGPDEKDDGDPHDSLVGAAQASDADNENDGVSEPVRQAPVKKAVAFVVGGEDDGNAGREVRKAVAFIAGADDAENDSGAPQYEGKEGATEEFAESKGETVESKETERPLMAEMLGEAAPVKQPTAQERRMAALAAAERRARKK